MNVLVTKKEEKALKELLSLSPVPEITLSYEELLGYIYGLAITPENVPPEEWFSVIFSEEAVPYESDEQARELTGVLFSILNKHVAAFQQQSLYIPFSVESLKEDEYERVFEWLQVLKRHCHFDPSVGRSTMGYAMMRWTIS